MLPRSPGYAHCALTGYISRTSRSACSTTPVRNYSQAAHQRPRLGQTVHRRPPGRRIAAQVSLPPNSSATDPPEHLPLIHHRQNAARRRPTVRHIQRSAASRPGHTVARHHTSACNPPAAGEESATAPPLDHCMASVIEGHSRHLRITRAHTPSAHPNARTHAPRCEKPRPRSTRA